MDRVAIDQFFQDCMMTPIFITDEMFEELAAPNRNMEDAINWCELPINVIYQVKFVMPMPTKYGNQVLLVLISKDGYEIKVWAPANVRKELKICTRSSNNTYIKSLGEKIARTSSSGRNKRYYDFETAYI